MILQSTAARRLLARAPVRALARRRVWSTPAASPPSLSHDPPAAERWANWNLPNLLSTSRIASAPLVGWTLHHEQYGVAITLLGAAALSDVADGWCARNLTWPFGGTSTLGVYLDPVGDKLLVGAVALPLTLGGYLPLWLSGLVLGRDCGLVGVGLVFRYFNHTPGHFFDPSDAGGEQLEVIDPTLLSKVNTALTFGLLGTTLFDLQWGLTNSELGESVLAHLPYVAAQWSAGDALPSLATYGIGATSAQALHSGACVVFVTTFTSGMHYLLRAMWIKAMRRTV